MGTVYTLDPNSSNAKIDADSTKNSNVIKITNNDENGNEKSAVDNNSLAFDVPKATNKKTLNDDGTLQFDSTDEQFDSMTLSEIMDSLNDVLHIENSGMTHEKFFNRATTQYNRFKTASDNDPLSMGFPHVFFIRPSCNIYLTSNNNFLDSSFLNNEIFSYVAGNCPEVLKELIASSREHDFMLSLSNASAGFSLRDEYIGYDTYGKTYTGYKIAYGKNNIDSKTAGEFSVTYNDTRDLRIYLIHKLWTEYINGVYRGEFKPRNDSIANKILDYVGACYYILTAEDNESIIFWAKYYGVFPVTAPVTQYTWGSGNTVNNPQIEIDYRYSFKEHMNPYTLLEFNYNAKISGSYKYVPTYDKKLGHAGRAWVGVPFIESVKDPQTKRISYKLRFAPIS